MHIYIQIQRFGCPSSNMLAFINPNADADIQIQKIIPSKLDFTFTQNSCTVQTIKFWS